MIPKSVKFLILTHILLSLGGLLLHVRIHPPLQTLLNWWAPAFGIVNLCVLPFLFSRSSTVNWAYLINFATVIAGTVGMAYFSIITWKDPLTLYAIFLNSTFPDIVILSAKLPVAHLIWVTLRPTTTSVAREGCRP
ncbi:MAG: hypothetical protein R6V46_14525 [Desulfatiglandaceae bacterium]